MAIRIGTSGSSTSMETPVLCALCPRSELERTRRPRHGRAQRHVYRCRRGRHSGRGRRGSPTALVAVKASRYLTHVRRLKEPRPPVELLVERASELGSHLGPILVQLPPDLELDLGALEETLDAFPAGIRMRSSRVTPRRSSRLPRALTERNVALCVADRRGPITPFGEQPIGLPRFPAGRGRLSRAIASRSSRHGPSASRRDGVSTPPGSCTSTTTAMGARCATRACTPAPSSSGESGS